MLFIVVQRERMQSLGKDVPELIVLPVYSALPSELQVRTPLSVVMLQSDR